MSDRGDTSPSVTTRRRTALVRDVSPRLGACELTHVDRAPIDIDRARRQHAGYCALLASLGWSVEMLPPLPEAPDGVFVEDTAVVLPEVAVLARPGAASRRAETDSVHGALRRHRTVRAITAPATLDGGDVLVLGRRVFVGESTRTSDDGIAQLRAALAPWAYEVLPIPVIECLHLKSAATAVGAGTVVVNPAWTVPERFAPARVIAVDDAEPHAANVLASDAHVAVTAAHAPRTTERLVAAGIRCVTVDLSELAKAEGALTCCSLLVG